MHHCFTQTDCHEHLIQTIPGVSSGSVTAPDHTYPCWLELQLTATDSGGLTSTSSVRLDPKTVVLTFAPGQKVKSVVVKIKGDLVREPNETFFVLLNSPVNATISDPTGSGGIINND